MLLAWDEAEQIFVCFSQFSERHVPKAAGFTWSPEKRRWFTPVPARAKALAQFADAGARIMLGLTDEAETAAVAASTASDSDLVIPAPDGLAYLPYQRAGIAYALARKHTLIADEMGLGKTIQAIGVVNALHHRPGAVADGHGGNGAQAGPVRILIVCPASLRLNWRYEWQRWCVPPIAPLIVTDSWPRQLRGDRDLFDARDIAAIVSYEGALKWLHHIHVAGPWDILILDEAHYLKSGAAKRTQAIFGFQRQNHPDYRPPIAAERKLLLTGTPIINRPEELWPILHAIDRDGLGRNRRDYEARYVRPAKWSTPAAKASLAELHRLLRQRVMVRRLKADVLTELPAKRRQVILLDVPGVGKILEREREMLEEKRRELAALQHEQAVEKLKLWRGAAMTELSRIRHETAVAKLPYVAAHLLDLLDEVPKLVVFVHHHDCVDGLMEAFNGKGHQEATASPPAMAVALDGRMEAPAKDAAVRRFQNDPGCRLFVGSIRAAGLGLTLTAASVVVFAELDWTPAMMCQAEDRLHRIGQRANVLVQHLVIDGSIDCKMARLLIAKQALMDAILDGKIPEALQRPILEEVLAP